MDQAAVVQKLQPVITQAKTTMWDKTPPNVDEQTLGILVGMWAHWEPERVLAVCLAALEEANMGDEYEALADKAKEAGLEVDR